MPASLRAGGCFVELGVRWDSAPAAPLIDPDVIKAAYCQSNRGTPTLAGSTAVAQQPGAGFENFPGATPQARLERMLEEKLGLSPQTVASSAHEREEGSDITPALRWLGLSNAGLSYLVRMRDVVQNGSICWNRSGTTSIISWCRCSKRRELRNWRRAENNQVFLGPEHFASPKTCLPAFPAAKTRAAAGVARHPQRPA